MMKFFPGEEGWSLPILLGTDVQLRFSKHPPFIYSIFLKSIPEDLVPGSYLPPLPQGGFI
jgi:hypothetical protein